MKTVRDIIEDCAEDYYPYHEYSGAYQDKNKESLDQALKELEEVILESLPERIDELDIKTAVNKGVAPASYNKALEDTRKVIKDLVK